MIQTEIASIIKVCVLIIDRWFFCKKNNNDKFIFENKVNEKETVFISELIKQHYTVFETSEPI